MKQLLFILTVCLVSGCATQSGIEKLQGSWVVDIKSTLLEHDMRRKQVLASDDEVTEINLSRIRYEFDGSEIRMFFSYNLEDDPGNIFSVNVFDEDKNSIVLYLPESLGKYPPSQPAISELVERNPFDAYHVIKGLIGFEFTRKNEAKLFYVALDAKRNVTREFSGLHLVKARVTTGDEKEPQGEPSH